jgi:small-conductance mechanosensitive channel
MHVRLPPEVREQLILLEDRLERAVLRRSAVPAALGLFLILGYFLLGDEILGEPQFTATVWWILLFGIGATFGMAVNEITARRTIRDVKEERETLRAPYERDALTSKTVPPPP